MLAVILLLMLLGYSLDEMLEIRWNRCCEMVFEYLLQFILCLIPYHQQQGLNVFTLCHNELLMILTKHQYFGTICF